MHNRLYRSGSQPKIITHYINITFWTAKIYLHINTQKGCSRRIEFNISFVSKTWAIFYFQFEEFALWRTIQPCRKLEGTSFLELFIISFNFRQYFISSPKSEVLICCRRQRW